MSLGWTQEQCAVQLKVTVRRLRRFEAGANITLQTLERIASALNVTARSLLDPPIERERRGPGRPRKTKPYAPPTPTIYAVAERVTLPKRTTRRRATKR